MIDREKIETMLADAMSRNGGHIFGFQVHVHSWDIIQLCRVYLAWMDAPERDAYLHIDQSGYLEGRIVCPISFDGKRVRLVEVGE